MKIIFFGLGSIGERHARLLLRDFNHTLFAFRSKRRSKPNGMDIKELYSWREVKELSPNVAFIANPTYLHTKTAVKCARLGINLFIEKPVDCATRGLDELIKLVKKRRLTTYVAYNLRFNPIIRRIRKELTGKKPAHARIVVSSYLPDWRPGRDYRGVYSARKSEGGGAIFDLSHEIDYCQYLFGDILKIQGVFGRLSDLKISSEDYADIIMKCREAVVNLHMNFFSKNLERTINIDFENSDYIKADLVNKTLCIQMHGVRQRYRYKTERDDAYRKQLRFFFRNFRNKRMMNNLIDASKMFRKIAAFKAKNEK